MGKLNNIVKIMTIIICITTVSKASVQQVDTSHWPTIEMTTKNPSIKVGEPLIFKFTYVFSSPQLARDSNEILKIYSHGDVGIRFYVKNSKGEITVCLGSSNSFPCTDDKGLIYSGNLILLFSMDATEKTRLLFNEPGKYTISPFAEQEQLEQMLKTKAPKPLVVDVKPASKIEKKALSILTGNYDLIILGIDGELSLDTKETSGWKERFQKVVEQCPDTMLAKMAAAHVGGELYSSFVRERELTEGSSRLTPSTQSLITQLRHDAAKYYEIALKLPDEFTIRELVLNNMANNAYLDKNYLKAISYLQELIEKYPQRTFGKSASKRIERIKAEIAKDPNWANRINNVGQSKPLGIVLPTVIGLASIILAAGGYILYKNKII